MSAPQNTPFSAPWPSSDRVRITGIRAIATAPEGVPLVVVRVDTSEPGLWGLGCATFAQRWRSVVSYVDDHLPALVVGRHPADIEDLTRLARFTSYWRDGPVDNSAISGLDMALWDIAGKRAGLPVHELLGGRVRAAAETYTHATGATPEQTIDHAREIAEAGWRHIRIQTAQPGSATYGTPQLPGPSTPDAPYAQGWRVRDYVRSTVALFERARAELPPSIELLHDAHSRLSPAQTVTLASQLAPYEPFFLEDPLAPEDWDRLPEVRAQSPVPIAVGELATSLREAARLVHGGGVDFIRCHISAIGGLTPARKLAALAEFFSVQTAWHQPPDTSPIGVAANVALDVTSPAFGIQETQRTSTALQEVFPGALVPHRGWLAPNDAPGWGIDLDEKLAAKFPAQQSSHDAWAAGVRAPDGALIAP